MTDKPKSLHKHFPYTNNTTVDFRVGGAEGTLATGAAETSANRLEMFGKHGGQAWALNNPDFPGVFGGYEIGLKDYDQSNLYETLPADAIVLASIPKYPIISGMDQIKYNSVIYLIYKRLDTNVIDYMELAEYSKGSEGYGINKLILNKHLFREDSFIAKGTQLTKSPMETQDGLYCTGRDAKTAVFSLSGTLEDSTVISESWAKENSAMAIYTQSINISYNMHPSYIYDTELMKFFPDLGEEVNPDGILMCLRKSTKDTFMSDILDVTSGIYSPLHDRPFVAPAGAKILDIDIWRNHVQANRVQFNNKKIYSQVDKYIDATIERYKTILKIYNDNQHLELSPRFSTLVSTAYKYLVTNKVRMKGINIRTNSDFIDKDEEIEYIKMKITYGIEMFPNIGSKFTGRDGGKVTASTIAKDEDMPVDENGIRADIVISPLGIPGRMNTIILDEIFINRTSLFVLEELKKNKSFDYLMEYYGTFNKNYADLHYEMFPTKELQDKYVEERIHNNKLHVNVLPFQHNIMENDEQVLAIENKYGSHETRVSFNVIDENGNRHKETSADTVCIGARYTTMLYALPYTTAPGFGHINHLKIPVKTASKSNDSHVAKTPIKVIGQDETRLLDAGMGPNDNSIFRLLCLHANSPEGVNAMMKAQLNEPYPTRISKIDISDQELAKTNTMVKLVNHELRSVGINFSNIEVPNFKEEDIPEIINDILETGKEIKTQRKVPETDDNKS